MYTVSGAFVTGTGADIIIRLWKLVEQNPFKAIHTIDQLIMQLTPVHLSATMVIATGAMSLSAFFHNPETAKETAIEKFDNIAIPGFWSGLLKKTGL